MSISGFRFSPTSDAKAAPNRTEMRQDPSTALIAPTNINAVEGSRWEGKQGYAGGRDDDGSTEQARSGGDSDVRQDEGRETLTMASPLLLAHALSGTKQKTSDVTQSRLVDCTLCKSERRPSIGKGEGVGSIQSPSTRWRGLVAPLVAMWCRLVLLVVDFLLDGFDPIRGGVPVTRQRSGSDRTSAPFDPPIPLRQPSCSATTKCPTRPPFS